MSLYAIGALHLHFQSVPAAGQQSTDKVWRNHELVFKKNCSRITSSDTLVLVGDHSWGRNLSEMKAPSEVAQSQLLGIGESIYATDLFSPEQA